MQQYDVVINGGGMVGAAMAVALAQQGKRVAVLETCIPAAYVATDPLDVRVSAFNLHAIDLLKRLGVFDTLLSQRACAYHGLEAWEDNPAHPLRFTAAEVNQPELGYFMENRLVQRALWDRFAALGITPYTQATLEEVFFTQAQSQVLLSDGNTLQSRWLLGCDGANSLVRTKAALPWDEYPYQQHCLLITVATTHENITWQAFSPTGPKALLPLAGDNASLVWYDSPARIAQLAALTAAELAVEIRQHFPDRLGDFSVTAWGAFPLIRRHAKAYHQGAILLVGDAAHTIHPLAGQGVNLGFKDVAALADLMAQDWQALDLGANYTRARKRDNQCMQTAMDGFYFGFSNPIPPLRWLRNQGLAAAQQLSLPKKIALRYALGLSLNPFN